MEAQNEEEWRLSIWVPFKFLNAVFKSVALNTRFNYSGLGEKGKKMSDKIKHTVFFGAMGILAAILIIAGIVVGGVHFPGLRLPSMISDKGRLVIEIMDKPVELRHLNLTIDWVKIQDQDENWHNLTLKHSPFYFDLLALQNVSETLSETEIPTGNYTMIRMHVLTANATYTDGTTDDLRVPSSVIKVLLKPHLKMESNDSITVLIDLQPEDLKSIAISHSLNLRPVVKARVNG